MLQLTSSTLQLLVTLISVERNKRTSKRAHAFLYSQGPSGVCVVEPVCPGSKPEPWLHAQLLFSPLFALYGPYFPWKAVSFPSPPQLYQNPASRGKIWLLCVQKPAAEGEKRFYKFWCQMFSRERKCATVRACVCVCVCSNGTSRHVVLNKCWI